MAMDFSAAINEIMPLVRDGDKSKPFIITRDSAYGDWQVCYPAPDKADSFTISQREHDPYTAKYFGADFDGGSMPYVYNKVLCDRLRLEFYECRDEDLQSGADKNRLHALINFFEDNINSFTHTVTDYLAELDEPFRALVEMCPYNLATDWPGWTFNQDLAADAVDSIENAVYDRLHPVSERTPLSSEHCLPNSAGGDFTGKTLIVKADALMPEYRDAESQIVKCTHGNGARPNAKGRSIFCKELASDKTVVYYREEIEGIADISKLPEWAKQKLSQPEKQQAKPAQPPQSKQPPSLLGEVREAAQLVEQRKTERGNAPVTKKRDEQEV